MKNLILFITIIIGNFAFCQTSNLSKSDIDKILCKTWKLDYGKIADNKINGLEANVQKYIFNNNGTYELSNLNSPNTFGKWNYVKKENHIEILNEKNINTGILKIINENQIVITQKLNGEIPNFQIKVDSVDFYFSVN